MDEVVAMTVPPPLPTKNQTRDLNQAAVAVGQQQSVSIRTVSLPSPLPSEEAGATVFIGDSAPAADSTAATCSRSRIPEVQSAIGRDWQKTVERPQQHVVKIRINPNDENGKVISTVRLNLDENPAISEIQNGFEYADKQNGVVLVCATSDLVKDRRASAETESAGCVRVSVVNGKNDINNDNNRSQHQLHKDEMIQRSAQEGLNSTISNGSTCFYYGSFQSPLTNMVMSSGQCSPSDTLDSGTCSDLDGTPPPLPKKNSSTILLSGGNTGGQHSHHRTGSLTSSGAEVDSDENDDDDDDDNGSNISCDSLNSRELSGVRVNGSCSTTEKGPALQQLASSVDLEKDSDSKAAEVARRGQVRRASTKLEIVLVNESDSDLRSNGHTTVPISNSRVSPCISPSPSGTSSLSKASSTPRLASPELGENRREQSWSPMVRECTYEERKQEQGRLEQEYTAASYYANYNRSLSGTKYVYDDDRFYKFHLNERCCDDENLSVSKVNGNGAKDSDNKENDEYFAGYKILEREAIRSAKGTVRGVKNRVRAGIATFLQKPSTKNYKTKDAGKVVVYTTTMGIVRETYYACMKVKQILRTHLVKYEERDMFMSTESQTELRDRIGSTTIQVPQLFIDGQYIGDADTVERLNESGELRLMLKPYKSADACTTCKICGGYRLLPCPVCNGSKKSVHRNDFTTEFVALKCMNCDEVGLVRCQHC